MTFSFCHLIIGTTLLTSTQFASVKTVRAFILAGESNIEGKAKNSLLDFQALPRKSRITALICATETSGPHATTPSLNTPPSKSSTSVERKSPTNGSPP